jgi:hypothetical protein
MLAAAAPATETALPSATPDQALAESESRAVTAVPSGPSLLNWIEIVLGVSAAALVLAAILLRRYV